MELLIYELLTNGVENPLAIDSDIPLFSWKITSNSRDMLQTAYQITIISQKQPDTVFWDSGKVSSQISSSVKYAGPVLTCDTKYTWKVQIWDHHNQKSPYSQPAVFGVGLSKTDWTASYIWDNTENENDFNYFRKTFQICKQVKRATVYTTAHNDFQLFLNSEQIGVGPARSDPNVYGQYCAYDITSKLIPGTNSFAALAHWHGVWLDSGVNAKPAFILEARVDYIDGSSEIIKTDDRWKVMDVTPYIEEDPVYFGFYGGIKNRASIHYDARRETSNWKMNSLDDNAWKNAMIVDRTDFNMFAQLVSEQTEIEELSPVSIEQIGDSWIIVFEKCISGWPMLHLHSNQRSDNVKIQYWEVLQGWGDAGYDIYTCAGGEETFKVPYVRHTSFKVLEISGYKGTLTNNDVRGILACSYADKQGSFKCSDSRLNNVYDMSERSGRQNVQQGIISVDANREQSPWTADSWNIGIGLLYNHKNSMIVDKTIKDYASEQMPGGNFYACSPAAVFEVAEWSLYWPMLLWEQYLFCGNEKMLFDYYGNLTKFLDDYMLPWRNENTGLYNPPGWRISDYAGGILENEGENIATNSQLYGSYMIAAKIANIINNKTDVEKYDHLAKELKHSINESLLVDGTCYKTTPGSAQTHPLGTAWAIRFDVVPDTLKENVAKWFAEQKDAYDIGGYGGATLYSALYMLGLGSIAKDDFARYDNMLNANFTNWESFGELSSENMGNHAWSAYPAYILQKYVGGITPTGSGCSSFDIKPVFDGLTWAEASVPTVKGNIMTRWKHQNNHVLTFDVNVPANSTATIYVPRNKNGNTAITENNTTVFENGKFVVGACGFHSGKEDGHHIVLHVGSGNYSLQVSSLKLHVDLMVRTLS